MIIKPEKKINKVLDKTIQILKLALKVLNVVGIFKRKR